jgi:hypothetical protein
MKPVQLKDSSPAEARPTPTMMGTRLSITGRGVASPRISLQGQTNRQYGAAEQAVQCSTADGTGSSNTHQHGKDNS